MKKYLIVCMSLIAASTAFSQPSEGSFVLGGSSAFNVSTEPNPLENNYRTTFHIMPNIGRFISDKFLLGGGIGYSLIHYRSNNGVVLHKYNEHEINGRIELSRFFPVTDKFYFNLTAGVNGGFVPMKGEFDASGVISSSNSFNITAGLGISPGISYFINQNWMIYSNIGAFGYALRYYENNGEIAHNLGYNFNNNPISLGVRYIFAK